MDSSISYASLSALPPETNYIQIVNYIMYFCWVNKTLELELRDVHKHWPSVRFTNSAQTQYSNIRTSRVLWTKYELMAYVVAYSTYIKLCRKICLEKSFIIWGCWDSTSGNNPLSETNLLWLCLGNYQCWYSLTYDMKLPFPASHVYIWNFTMKILYHIKSSIARFDMFRKIYNQEILQC